MRATQSLVHRGPSRTNLADDHRIDVAAFGERQLDDVGLSKGPAPDDASSGTSRLLSAITRCPDGVARERQVRAAIRDAGFQWLCYWRIHRMGGSVRHAAWFDTYSPPAWRACFERSGFLSGDPRIDPASRCDWPFAWDLASLCADRHGRHADPATRRFSESAARAGVRSGVTIGLPTGKTFQRAIVTLSSARADRRWITDKAIGEAHAVALAMHEFVQPRLRHLIADPEAGVLNDVQHAVLRFVSQGISNREIAERLSISTHVVAYHLEQLERRYAARNRVQLAYRAGRILHE
jgi:DNA-binding CsgD family transcriptional regulator